tara:strand:- start:1371 stop:1511 length:141 start_codon:yes stop_codon:yes gene_type:complete
LAKNLPKRRVIRLGSIREGKAKIKIITIAEYKDKLNINDLKNCINF